MIYVEDDDGTLLEFPDETIQGESKATDGSIRFKLLGGKYHDAIIRVYKLGETVILGDEIYKLHPPVRSRSNKWVYAHTPTIPDLEATL